MNEVLNESFSNCVATGQKLTGCKDGELDKYNGNPAAATEAWHGAYGLISQRTAGAFLALAHRLEKRPLLWHFMSAGFSEGFTEMATRIKGQPDFEANLVRLASGLQQYPDLLKLMQQGLNTMGVDLQIKPCRIHDGRKFCAVAIRDQQDVGNTGYILMSGTTNVIAIDDLDKTEVRIRDEVLSLVSRQQREFQAFVLRAA